MISNCLFSNVIIGEYMFDIESYELGEYWDLSIKQKMTDGNFQTIFYNAAIGWLDNNCFEGEIIQLQNNTSFKVQSGYALNGPLNMGTISFEVIADNGSVRSFQGNIVDKLSIWGSCILKDEKHPHGIKEEWCAFRYEKYFNENEDENEDSELSPSEIPCPFCGELNTSCSHFLALFDCTFDGEGEYGIGLIGGAIYKVEMIDEFFKEIAYCYARARYKGKKSKLPKVPKGFAFSEYIRALEKVLLDAKAYNSEEDYCWDFHANIERYADLVRRSLLEILPSDVYEKEASIERMLFSTQYALWFCNDAKATAVKLKEDLARYLSNYKGEKLKMRKGDIINGDNKRTNINSSKLKMEKRIKEQNQTPVKAQKPVKQKKITSRETINNFEDKLIDVKKWLRRVKNPEPYKPTMPHLPSFAPSFAREKTRLKYLEDLKKWETLWDKERENRVKELKALQSLYTASEWQELMYDLTRSIQQILRDQEDRRRKIKQKKEEEAKLFSLITSIVEKYPWPAEPQRKSKLRKDKLRANKKRHGHENEIAGRIYGDDEEDVPSTVKCPECGKVFMRLDKNGCCVKDFGRCKDLIGEGDYGDLYFKKEFNVLSDILRIYRHYTYDDTYDYINPLAGVNLIYDEDWACFLEALGISVTTNMCEGGGPGNSGDYSFLTACRESQDFLLKKLIVIKSRLEALEEHDRGGGLDGPANDE
jgi:hypothetical protein